MPDLADLHELYRTNLTSEMVVTLAEQLGVSPKALYALDLGYNAETNAWIFPERDAGGNIIGLLQRFWDGRKTCIKGSKRGLAFVPVTVSEGYDPSRQKWLRVSEDTLCPICRKPDWCCSDGNSETPRFVLCMRIAKDAVHTCQSGGYIHEIVPGSFHPMKKFRSPLATTDLPVLIVEGHTDAAAAFDLGFVAVGRPSAEGGMSELAKLMQGVSSVVVVGENDSGAGRKGMEQTFDLLRPIVKTIVKLLPPSGIKDLRQWIRQGLTQDQLLQFVRSKGDQTSNNLILESVAPLELARVWLDATYKQGDVYTLKYLHGDWFRFTGRCYEEVDRVMLRKSLYDYFGDKKYKKLKNGGFDISAFEPNKFKLDQILDAALAFCTIPDADVPCWLTPGGERPDPARILVFPNGMLDIEKCVRGDFSLAPLTPEFFTVAVYPYEFDLSATCPQWERFLSGIFADDGAKRSLLQEWFGYNLIPDNSYEKFMMLLGPPRAGKGTILEVLAHILGERQIVATTFRDYTRRFGLYPFIGKLAALIGDVSVGLNYDATEALNVLKRITGNDVVTIEQKGQDITQTCIHLNTRFTMAANTMPRLPDFVRAIESRILTIQFLLTFAGREDYGLKERLKNEAPGILLWALDGLKRLRANKLFTLPTRHDQVLLRIRSELTPFAEFVDDCCDLGGGESFFVPQGRLYECWKVWASKNGELGHSIRWMVRVLTSLYPTCGFARHNLADGSRPKVFTGIKLQPHAAIEFVGE